MIYAPASRKVVGFDVLPPAFMNSMLDYERDAAKNFTEEAAFEGVDPEDILSRASIAGLDGRLELVVGDVAETAAEYVRKNRGFRISLFCTWTLIPISEQRRYWKRFTTA